MDTATRPKRIAGLTIACDHCDRRATHRWETKGAVGFDVHWTCDSDTPTA